MKLDYSKTLNEQRDTIENILNENKHYSLQLSQLKQDKQELENNLDRLDKYKNAWEELKEDCKEVEKDDDCVLFSRLEQLERIYGIEVE